MKNLLPELVPPLILFVLGYILQKTSVIKKEEADLLLKIVFFISLPSLLILSVANINLSADLIYLPIVAMWIILITFFLSFFIGKFLNLERKSFNVFLIGSMIMEISFTLPFVIGAYGDEGLARILLFDFGNSLLVFTFVYFIASQRGGKENSYKTVFNKVLLSPPVWAIASAIIINVINLKIPFVIDKFLKVTGNTTIPLVMLSLGIYFSPKLTNLLPSVTAVFLRMFIGFSIGFFLVELCGIEGISRTIALVGASAPICYNTLTFSSLQDLDKELASNLISFSVLIGFVLVPLIIFFFG